MQASPGSDGATWACGVRWVVSECSMVLLVAVKTAVTWWWPALGVMAEAGVHATQKKRVNLSARQLSIASRTGDARCHRCIVE
jgi:hypothetical protein